MKRLILSVLAMSLWACEKTPAPSPQGGTEAAPATAPEAAPSPATAPVAAPEPATAATKVDAEPDTAMAAQAAYNATLAAYNAGEMERYVAGFAPQLSCFYNSRDVDGAATARRRAKSPGWTRQQAINVVSHTPTEVALIDVGVWAAGGKAGTHEKGILMTKVGDDWRISAEFGRTSGCHPETFAEAARPAFVDDCRSTFETCTKKCEFPDSTECAATCTVRLATCSGIELPDAVPAKAPSATAGRVAPADGTFTGSLVALAGDLPERGITLTVATSPTPSITLQLAPLADGKPAQPIVAALTTTRATLAIPAGIIGTEAVELRIASFDNDHVFGTWAPAGAKAAPCVPQTDEERVMGCAKVMPGPNGLLLAKRGTDTFSVSASGDAQLPCNFCCDISSMSNQEGNFALACAGECDASPALVACAVRGATLEEGDSL